jgi:hypothetical protein
MGIDLAETTNWQRPKYSLDDGKFRVQFVTGIAVFRVR